MSVGVGSGDYAEFIPAGGGPTPSGPADLYIIQGLLGLVGSTFEQRGFYGTLTALNVEAVDGSTLEGMRLQPGFGGIAGVRRVFSTDAGDTVDDFTHLLDLPFGQTINSTILLWRAGTYAFQVYEDISGDGTTGGLWESSDNGATWTHTRMLPRAFGANWQNADIWTVTPSHVYYLIRDDEVGSGYHSIQVDALTGTPAVQQLIYNPSATPSGGTWWFVINFSSSPTLAWNASAADIQTALEALLGVGVTCSGNLSTGVTVTFGEDGPKQDLFIQNTSLTPFPSSILSSTTTPGTSGIKSYSPTESNQGMWGSFTNDVVMVGWYTASAKFIDKITGGSTVTDVTPGFFTNDTILTKMISPDGTLWVGLATDQNTGISQLFRSDDGGSSWALVGPTADAGIWDLCFDPAVPGRWLAVMQDSGVRKVWESLDDAATWSDPGWGPSLNTSNFSSFQYLVPIGGGHHD